MSAPASPPHGRPGATGPFTTGRRFWALVAVLVGIRLLALGVVLNSGQEQDDSILGGDARRYTQMATSVGKPYVDYEIEYPPLVLGSIRLIVDPDDKMTTLIRLGLSQLALDLATAAALWWGFGRRVLLTYLLLGAAFLPYPLPYMRLDLLSVFLASLGWALLRRRRETAGGGLLALSVFAKVWPLAVAPLLLVERRRRATVAFIATGAAGALAWGLWSGFGGMVQVVSFRGATGWQVESLPGNVLQIMDHTRTHFESGAWRIGTMPGFSRPLFGLLSIGFTAVAWWWVRPAVLASAASPGPDEARLEAVRFGVAPLVAVTAFLVFSSIISPQYMLWLLPYAAVAASHAPRRYFAPVFLVNGLSALGLAVIHGQFDGAWWATVPVLARNLLLVWLLVVAMADLRPARRTVRPSARHPDHDDGQDEGEGADQIHRRREQRHAVVVGVEAQSVGHDAAVVGDDDTDQ